MKDFINKISEYFSTQPRINIFWVVLALISTLIFVCVGSFIAGGGF